MSYGAVIPLIGGMALGNAKATGEKPAVMVSWGSVFGKNERHIQHHWPDVPYLDADVPFQRNLLDEYRNLDFFSAVPPCAGLSITSSTSGNHGAESTHNEWMYRSLDLVLSKARPKVVFGENAPGLFGDKGKPVARRMAEIGKAHGYAFSMIYTNTNLHGIPQARKRTFYFLWRTKTAPRFVPMKQECPTLSQYLKQYGPPKAEAKRTWPYDVEFSEMPLNEDIYIMFAQNQWGEAWRSESEGKTILETIKNRDLVDVFFQWGKNHAKDHPQFKKVANHRENVKGGRAMWDDSPKLVNEYTPAVMFKNIKRIVHPVEDRFLTARELMGLMGFPQDFNLYLNPDQEPKRALETAMHHISQNVPVSTASDMTTYILDVLDGRVKPSNSDFYMYDNVHERRVRP
jgi:site-specific DNA-cytosine methylase